MYENKSSINNFLGTVTGTLQSRKENITTLINDSELTLVNINNVFMIKQHS